MHYLTVPYRVQRDKSAEDYPMLSRKTVTEVLKGGSLGHGTTVPGEFDVDLVLLSEGRYSRAISDESYSRAGLWWVLKGRVVVGAQGQGCGGCSRAGLWWVLKGWFVVGAQGLVCGGCSRAGLWWVLKGRVVVGAKGLGDGGCSRAGLWFTWLLKGWVVI